jgi:anti-anti-sigma factor
MSELQRDGGSGDTIEAELDEAPFDATVVSFDGRVVVSVRGEIDLSTSDEFWKAIEEGLSMGRRLVIDLAETSFLDSVALGLLVRAHLRVRAFGEVLELHNPSPFSRKVLDISGLLALPTIQVSGPDGIADADGQRPVDDIGPTAAT